MYIEYIEKFLNGVKKAYAKLFKKCLVQETPKAKKNVKPKKTTKRS